MIHAPDDTDSIIARLASRLEFFNSLGHKKTLGLTHRCVWNLRTALMRLEGKSFIPLHDDLEKTVQSQYLANEYTGQSGCGIIVAYLFSQTNQWEVSYDCRN